MTKLVRPFRITVETDALLRSEAARLTEETGKKVSQADVIEMAVVRWCGADSTSETVEVIPAADADHRRATAIAAMQDAERRPEAPVPSMPKLNPRAGSVAQRREREKREHAAALAESDTTARIMGRNDIEYDLDDVKHRQTGLGALPRATESRHYDVLPRKVRPIPRPHGHTDSKKRHTEGK